MFTTVKKAPAPNKTSPRLPVPFHGQWHDGRQSALSPDPDSHQPAP